jgi:hypothetical protein
MISVFYLLDYKCFKGTYCLHRHGIGIMKTEAVGPYKITWCHNSEEEGRKILKWIFKKVNGKIWTGFI